MALTEDDRLWRDQNFPNMSDQDFEKIVKTFGGNGKDNDNGNLNAKEVIEEASEIIMRKYRFITIEETGQIWYHKDGVYMPGGDILIAKECEKMFGYDLNTERLTQIKGHIIRKTYHKNEELDADKNIINLKNGLYDIDNNTLKEHTPDYLSINQKPITYVKGAKPKRFGSFLGEVMYSRNIRTAVEAMAYTFERDYPFETIFMLYGLGSNGKTVYTSVSTSLHGVENVSNVPLAEMVRDKFALSDLENKDLNIDNELGNQTIKDTAILKRLTGGSRQRIRIQRKNQRAYDTTLYAKLFFNANQIPDSYDTSDAYNRRLTIISFPYRFEGDKADKKLISKLIAEDEISGIFNVLMIALRRIRKTKDIYVDEKTIEEKRIKYERTAKPIQTFINEAVAEDSTADFYVTKEQLFEAYNTYCKKYMLPTEKYDTFCKQVKNFRFDDDDRCEIRDSRRDIGEVDKDDKPKKTAIWVGVVLTGEYELKEAQQKLV